MIMIKLRTGGVVSSVAREWDWHLVRPFKVL